MGRFSQGLARQRQTIGLYDYIPVIDGSAYVSPNAVLVGEVKVSSDSCVLSGSVIRGDVNAVTIENHVQIGENCSVSVVPSIYKSGELAECTIGENCVIGANSSLVSCTLERTVFVGPGSVVCEGAVIEKEVVVGPNSVVPPSRILPARTLWAGNPVRFVKNLTKEEISMLNRLKIDHENNMRTLASHEIELSSNYIWEEEEMKKILNNN